MAEERGWRRFARRSVRCAGNTLGNCCANFLITLILFANTFSYIKYRCCNAHKTGWFAESACQILFDVLWWIYHRRQTVCQSAVRLAPGAFCFWRRRKSTALVSILAVFAMNSVLIFHCRALSPLCEPCASHRVKGQITACGFVTTYERWIF